MTIHDWAEDVFRLNQIRSKAAEVVIMNRAVLLMVLTK